MDYTYPKSILPYTQTPICRQQHLINDVNNSITPNSCFGSLVIYKNLYLGLSRTVITCGICKTKSIFANRCIYALTIYALAIYTDCLPSHRNNHFVYLTREVFTGL